MLPFVLSEVEGQARAAFCVRPTTSEGSLRNSVPLLQIQRLTRTFGGITAVGALDLAVEQGTFVSVIGPNGAGKTTLFNLITGLDAPDAGRIMLCGQPIKGLSPARVAALGIA